MSPSESHAVISPEGVEIVDSVAVAPRLADLNGKTVGEIWNGVFRGNETFPVLRARLQQRFPGVRIIPYTEFPHTSGDDRAHAQQGAAREIAAAAVAKGCDAVIIGNGA